jgi:hypothetical protein
MTESTDAKALFRAFVVCLIVAALPIKNAAYVTPVLYLLILWVHGERRIVGRVIMLGSAILTISSMAVLWDHLGGRTVNFPGLWWGLLTYGTILVVLCETFDRSIDPRTYDKFVNVCSWFILFQSLVGIFQFVATRNPDAVCGTLGLLDGFRNTITIAQVYFTFMIFGMILFLIPASNQWLPRVAIVAGAMTCVLAQSGHQTGFFVAALVVCGLSRLSHIGTLARTVMSAAAIVALVLQFYPNTIWLADEWYQKVTDTSQSPKWLALEGAASIMAEPKNLLMGTGLGQYASRAALISSNEYLSVQLPSFMTSKSDYYVDHIEPSVVLFSQFGEGSAMAKPYMSVISLPVELGLVLTTVLLAMLCSGVIWCIRIMTRNSDELGRLGFSMLAGILFFVLCCFVENYAEFSQAIFVPFILFVVAGSRGQTLLSAEKSDRLASHKRLSRSSVTSYRLPMPLKPR